MSILVTWLIETQERTILDNTDHMDHPFPTPRGVISGLCSNLGSMYNEDGMHGALFR